MLTEQDKERIEEEERYRAEVREELGPVRVVSFTDRVNKFNFWVQKAAYVLLILAGLWLMMYNS